MCHHSIPIETIIDLSIKGFLAVIAAVGGLVGFKQYVKTYKWKKQEFLSNQIKEFFNDPFVDRALLMLDWNYYTLKDENNIPFKYTKELLITAMEYHIEREIRILKNGMDPCLLFSKEERFIRLVFDNFFQKLGVFQNNIDNNLYTIEDIKPYLHYYLDIIGDNNNISKKDIERHAIWNYLIKYNFNSVIKLLKSFGYDIKSDIKIPLKFQINN